ncbi:MAG: pilus assembly protein [Acidimicrobiia bacterium]|nr:pilus assembly protein [Acidimicrobiia bacterium]
MSGGGLRTNDNGEEGQSTVELALVLPLVALVLLAVVQVGLIVRDQVMVVHAAREAAREAAVEPNPDAARRAALAGAGLEGERLDVAVSGRGAAGSRVRVEVRYRAPTRVPLVGVALGDLSLEATATMRVER